MLWEMCPELAHKTFWYIPAGSFLRQLHTPKASWDDTDAEQTQASAGLRISDGHMAKSIDADYFTGDGLGRLVAAAARG